ncbi:MAG: hypothetical protein HLUCCA04_08795 [Oceanicaulis sp. HLUCCA04]|nr:MAG: hypothetical protein HLUCCA04_08795 [Oceanicaulis sp. HLUCCA04]
MMLLAALSLALLQPEEPAAEAAEPVHGNPAHAAGFLTGRFSNQRQWDNAGPEREREPVAGDAHEWLDLQFATHTLVEAPQLGEHVIYVEWRSGDEDGAISRQRIWVLREDEAGGLAGFDFFTFRDPAPYEGRGQEPGAFADLSAEDLIGYPEGCLAEAQNAAHVGYYFTVDPETCAITAQSGTPMRIHASIRALGNSLTYREQGTMEDNTIVFRVPGTAMPYSFVRIRDEGEEGSDGPDTPDTPDTSDTPGNADGPDSAAEPL